MGPYPLNHQQRRTPSIDAISKPATTELECLKRAHHPKYGIGGDEAAGPSDLLSAAFAHYSLEGNDDTFVKSYTPLYSQRMQERGAHHPQWRAVEAASHIFAYSGRRSACSTRTKLQDQGI